MIRRRTLTLTLTCLNPHHPQSISNGIRIPRLSLRCAPRPDSNRFISFLSSWQLISASRRNFSSGALGVRSMSTRIANDSGNRPPKETILLDGCDFEHWLVVVEPPDPNLVRDEIIDSYIKTLAKVVGSEEEARMKIYSVSTKHYFAFSCLVSEELSNKLKELPNVRWVLPDSYLDVKNKDYGGEPFINGKAVPYDPKYHELWVRNHNESLRRNQNNRMKDRSRRRDNVPFRENIRPSPPTYQNSQEVPNQSSTPLPSDQNRASPNFSNKNIPAQVQTPESQKANFPYQPLGGFQNRNIQADAQNTQFQNNYSMNNPGGMRPMENGYAGREMPNQVQNGYPGREMQNQMLSYPGREMQNQMQNSANRGREIQNQMQSSGYPGREMPNQIQNSGYPGREMQHQTQNTGYPGRDLQSQGPNNGYRGRDLQTQGPNNGYPGGDMEYQRQNNLYPDRDVQHRMQNNGYPPRDFPQSMQNQIHNPGRGTQLPINNEFQGPLQNPNFNNRDVRVPNQHPMQSHNDRYRSNEVGVGSNGGNYQGMNTGFKRQDTQGSTSNANSWDVNNNGWGNLDGISNGQFPNRDHQSRDAPFEGYEAVGTGNS